MESLENTQNTVESVKEMLQEMNKQAENPVQYIFGVTRLCLILAKIVDKEKAVNRILRKRLAEVNEVLKTSNTNEHD